MGRSKSNIPQLESELAQLEAKIKAAEERLARAGDGVQMMSHTA